MPHDAEKEVAARASLRFVRDGAVVGLGSGSTATDVLRLLGERIRAGLKILGIPTSRKTGELAAILGIPLTTFDQIQEIDVTIDGADEFDPQLSVVADQRRWRRIATSESGRIGLAAIRYCGFVKFWPEWRN